jgi:hypothetical protein
MNTLLFAVGIFVFMLTVYGSVMAGGAVLKQLQVDDLADDVDYVVNDHGWEVLAGSPARAEHPSQPRRGDQPLR